MKQTYLSPELEITLLTSEDLLTGSLDDEVMMDGSDGLFDGV